MKISDERIDQLNQDIEDIICQYRDIPSTKLAEIFKVNMGPKNALNTLTYRMVESSGSLALRQLLSDDDFRFKTVRLDKYGRLRESMSLPAFRYTDIVGETWETSELRSYFYQKIFAFMVFRAERKELFLNKIILWKMPEHVLESSVCEVWKRIHYLLKQGLVVKYIDDNGRYFTYFPSSAENPYVHVRPHAQNRQDTFPLPVADKLTGLVQYPKHSFWLNRAYILKIINKEEK